MQELVLQSELEAIVAGCTTHNSDPDALLARLRECAADLGTLKIETLRRGDAGAQAERGFWTGVALGRLSPNRYSGLDHPRAGYVGWTQSSNDQTLRTLFGNLGRDDRSLASVCLQSQRIAERHVVRVAPDQSVDRFVARMAFLELLVQEDGSSDRSPATDLPLSQWKGIRTRGKAIEFLSDVVACEPNELAVVYVLPIARTLLRKLQVSLASEPRGVSPASKSPSRGAQRVRAARDGRRLTDKQCKALQLSQEGKSPREIARNWQCDESTVRQHIDAGRLKLGIPRPARPCTTPLPEDHRGQPAVV